MSYNVRLVGLGGIGAAYASQATDSGFRIPFICDTERKHRYEQATITVNSKPYQFDYVSSPNPEGPVDLILVAVKFQQLEQVCRLIGPFVSDNTIILSLLNGISSEYIIRQQLGKGIVIPALVNGTDGQRNGFDFRYSSKGKIVFGVDDETDELDVERAETIMQETGLGFEVSEKIEYLLWWKFMVNVGINHTSAILGTSYKYFHTESHAKAIARMGMKEVLALSNKLDKGLTREDIDKAFGLIASLSGENKISTLQDVEAKRPTEVDMLAGEVVRLGRKHDIPTPVNELYFHAVKHIEENY